MKMKTSYTTIGIISAITEDTSGTVGFKNYELKHFFTGNYEQNKTGLSALRDDIITYRTRTSRLKDATKYSTYGASVFVSVLGGLGIKDATSGSTPSTWTSVVNTGLGVALLFIRSVCGPWATENEQVVKRLEAVLAYAQIKIVQEEKSVDRKEENIHSRP